MTRSVIQNNVIGNKDIKWCLGIILLMLTWGVVAPTFYGLIKNGAIGIWLERLCTFLEHNTSLNIIVCLWILFFYFYNIRLVVQWASNYVFFFFVILFSYFVLYYQSPIEFLTIVTVRLMKVIEIDINYRSFFTFLLLVLLYDYLVKLFAKILEKDSVDEPIIDCVQITGFSAEGDYEIKPTEAIQEYANSIIERLLNTSLKKESYAVGIISEWGAGKTTFLNLLRNKIKEDVNIVDFNPWMCSTPEQVTNTFFSSLCHQLSEKHRELSKPIRRYAQLLQSATLHLPGLRIKFSGFLSEKSLFERKRELSEKFIKIDNPIVVVIDDLDRLESDEVFEVLRLIRNTADLKNMIYLVAFDKEYVISILEEKKINDPIAYLEKIFQVEIQLPLVLGEQIMDTLIKEMNYQLGSGFDNRPDFVFSKEEKALILSVVTTYRRAKRFARLFSLNLTHLLRTSFAKLEWRDVFWLNLLQMCDKNVYDNYLCGNPSDILVKEGTRWLYRESPAVNLITSKILLKLFGEEDADTPLEFRIYQTEYYDKYFTLQVLFSREDLETLINAENVEDLVLEWKTFGKQIDNIYNIVSGFDVNQLDIQKKEKLIIGILDVYYYFDSITDSNFITIEKIREVDKTIWGKVFLKWFNDKLDADCDLIKLSSLLKCIEDVNFDLFDLTEKRVMAVFLEKNPTVTVLNLKNHDDELYKIILQFPKHTRLSALENLIYLFVENGRITNLQSYKATRMQEDSIISVLNPKERVCCVLQIKRFCCGDISRIKEKLYSSFYFLLMYLEVFLTATILFVFILMIVISRLLY